MSSLSGVSMLAPTAMATTAQTAPTPPVPPQGDGGDADDDPHDPWMEHGTADAQRVLESGPLDDVRVDALLDPLVEPPQTRRLGEDEHDEQRERAGDEERAYDGEHGADAEPPRRRG